MSYRSGPNGLAHFSTIGLPDTPLRHHPPFMDTHTRDLEPSLRKRAPLSTTQSASSNNNNIINNNNNNHNHNSHHPANNSGVLGADSGGDGRGSDEDGGACGGGPGVDCHDYKLNAPQIPGEFRIFITVF